MVGIGGSIHQDAIKDGHQHISNAEDGGAHYGKLLDVARAEVILFQEHLPKELDYLMHHKVSLKLLAISLMDNITKECLLLQVYLKLLDSHKRDVNADIYVADGGDDL